MTIEERAKALIKTWQNRTILTEEMITDVCRELTAAIEADRKSRSGCEDERAAILTMIRNAKTMRKSDDVNFVTFIIESLIEERSKREVGGAQSDCCKAKVEAEREACAEIVDCIYSKLNSASVSRCGGLLLDAAMDIRARGKGSK